MNTIKKWILKRLKRNTRRNRAPMIMITRVERCICCGEPIPEGRGVCWRCEHKED